MAVRSSRGNKRIGICSHKCKGRGKRARKVCIQRCMCGYPVAGRKRTGKKKRSGARRVKW